MLASDWSRLGHVSCLVIAVRSDKLGYSQMLISDSIGLDNVIVYD